MPLATKRRSTRRAPELRRSTSFEDSPTADANEHFGILARACTASVEYCALAFNKIKPCYAETTGVA
jgi:hypothetical protein